MPEGLEEYITHFVLYLNICWIWFGTNDHLFFFLHISNKYIDIIIS